MNKCIECLYKLDFYKIGIFIALEKQMPKMPNYVPDDDTCVYYHWECPECGNYMC